jgi:hypothetical protein
MNTATKPKALPVIPDSIPLDLRAMTCRLVWMYVEEVDPETGETDWDKPPLNARGGAGSSTNRRTWSTFDIAIDAYQRGGLDGIGMVLPAAKKDEAGTVLIGVDLDNCRDPQTGVIEQWAQQIIDTLNTYTEVSPSGTGFRLFLRGRLPPDGRKRKDFECYCWARYVTVTGQHLDGTPLTIEDREAEILAVHKKIWPEHHEPKQTSTTSSGQPVDLTDLELIEKAKRMKKGAGAKFAALWSGDTSGYASKSEADLALVNYLAFFCGPNSSARVDALFRQSGLFRSKWNRKDYRDRTIAKAFDGRTEYCQPPRGRAFLSNHRANGNGKPHEAAMPTAGEPVPSEVIADNSDQHPPSILTNYRIEKHAGDDGKVTIVKVGMPHAHIAEELRRLTGGWPKWSSPRKVDTGLMVIPPVRTPPGRRTPATSDDVEHCRRPRCTRRAPPVPPTAWRSRHRGPIPS